MTRVLPRSRLLRLNACLLALAAVPVADADEVLGRLFFAPERRQQLDRQRELNVPDRQLPADSMLTIDGLVVRSSGRRTAWVNASPHNEDEAWSDVSVTPQRGEPGRVWFEANDAPTVRARVGETINRSSGEATDLLQGGRIVIKAQPRPAR